MADTTDFWTDETSVLLTSFWGWSPETWGTVGWTGERGWTRRENLLRELTNPFIAIIYATSNFNYIDPSIKGKVAGFYLMSHEKGDRHEFTDAWHHNRNPESWRHSLRALRAFTYLPESRLSVAELDPRLLSRARSIAAMGEVIEDKQLIRKLRNTPWIEVPVFRRTVGAADPHSDPTSVQGHVRAGPSSENGYAVSPMSDGLKRKLYVLRLDGDTEAYVGEPCKGCSIYKVGLSVSPDMRRLAFQRSMPRGAFEWRIDRTTNGVEIESFDAAVAGEDAMKHHLAANASWLGGEFYLASAAVINEAWKVGCETAAKFVKKRAAQVIT